MKKAIVFIISALLCALTVSCVSPEGGTVPPVTKKGFTIDATYICPKDEVLDPSKLYRSPFIYMGTNYGSVIDRIDSGLTRIDDYNFSGTFPNLLFAGSYCWTTRDVARYNGSDKGTYLHGAILVLRVRETGSEIRIVQETQNTIQGLAESTPMSLMTVVVDLTEDGYWII